MMFMAANCVLRTGVRKDYMSSIPLFARRKRNTRNFYHSDSYKDVDEQRSLRDSFSVMTHARESNDRRHV